MDTKLNMSEQNGVETTKEGIVYSIDIPDQSMEEIRDKYNKWTSYEKDLLAQDFRAPQYTVDSIETFYTVSDRQTVKILDVGAGTGILGQQLRNVGFTQIDALDPSNGMLGVAKQRGIYDKYYEEFLTAKSTKDISPDTYDILTGLGCFGENHIPFDALHEIIRIVKPGGMVFIASKDAYHEYFKGMQELVDNLKTQGKLEHVDTIMKPVFRTGFKCVLCIYRVL